MKCGGEAKRAYVARSGTAVSYREAGQRDRQTVVLLHGIGSSSASWQQQLNTLDGAFHVIAWDAPGYGSSVLLSADVSPQGYASRLNELLDAAGVDSVHLVASSWGTLIASVFARMYPDRVLSIVMSGPTVGLGALPAAESKTITEQRLQRMQHLGPVQMQEDDIGRLVAPRSVEQALPILRSGADEVTILGFRDALQVMCKADGIENIKQLKQPLLILTGTEDQIAPAANHAMKLVAALPAIQIRHMDGCGHLPHVEMPEQFDRHLQDFWSSCAQT
jgi:pimeloyl-ACP methyl ester carboxylesterase